MKRSVFRCPVRGGPLLALGVSLFACATAAPPTLENAVPANAPDTVTTVEQGYALPSCTHGLGQSPIDILTKAVLPVAHAVSPHYESSQGHIRNLGHTIQLDYDGGSYLEFEGERYDLVQFHFHTPSEHRIDGMTFPMELHVVHRRHDDGSGTPHYLVVGVLYKCGDEDRFLAGFLDSLPKGEHDRADLTDLRIAIRDLLGNELSHFYHYSGSLTTPPFSETVQWLVLQRVFEAGPAQIEHLNRLEGNNARHVQALQGRVVDTQK